MIEKETVLILGAGASHELGFPLSPQLKNEILAAAKGETAGFQRSPKGIVQVKFDNAQLLCGLLEKAGEKRNEGWAYTVNDIERFAKNLEEADPRSIDEFLFRQPDDFSLIGKMLILIVLSKYEENQSKLKTKGWYSYLRQRLFEETGKDFENLKENKLRIITFNYDRSLENYLYKSILATYDFEAQGRHDIAASFFDKGLIKHVYGDLGVFSWQFNYQAECRHLSDVTNNCIAKNFSDLFPLLGNLDDFAGEAEHWNTSYRFATDEQRKTVAKGIIERAKRIKTSYEASQKADFREIFKKAERVYFLGFNYDENNIEALGLNSGSTDLPLSHDVEIYGTAAGKTDKQVEDIQHFIASFSTSPDRIHIMNTWKGIEDKDSSKITSFLINSYF